MTPYICPLYGYVFISVLFRFSIHHLALCFVLTWYAMPSMKCDTIWYTGERNEQKSNERYGLCAVFL